jgi:uncharacterized PurR-regulated membrane protein YhhQ (DUF165 family)
MVNLRTLAGMPCANSLGSVVVRVHGREPAQGLVEYGLIIALVAVLAIAGLVIFGPAVSSLLSNLGASV